MEERRRHLMLVEIAVMVAFAYILSLFRVARMPQGGSVSLQMLPVFVIALRWGGGAGMVTGLLLSGVKLMVDPFIVHPVQALLDYPFAFSFIGVAGFLRRQPLAGIIAGGLSRFFMHFRAGVVFFGEFAPEGTPVVIHSLVYNMTYMGPEIVVALVTTPLVLRRLFTKKEAESLSWRRNLVEVLSFVIPLAAMALVVGPRDSIVWVNQTALVTWLLLALYHIIRLAKGYPEARQGLVLVSVPPAVVYLAFRVLDLL